MWAANLAKRGEVGMSERCLELTGTETEFRTDGIVDPSLLKHVASGGCRIDADVIVDLSEGLARETDDGIRHGKAGVGDIVLIVGLVETFIIVVFKVEGTLQIEIGLEYEAPVITLECEATVVGYRNHAVVHIQL